MSRNAKIVLLVILAAIFVAEAAAAAVIVFHRSKTHSSGSTGSNSQVNAAMGKDACSIFTLAEAKQVLNGDASGGAMAVTGSSKDVQVSGCSYKLGNTSAPSTSVTTASLVVHFPKTAQGIASNQKVFDGQKPPGSVPVSGYGDKAYWDAQLGQLNILKNNTWYVITNGTAVPSDRSLAQAKILADILKNNL